MGQSPAEPAHPADYASHLHPRLLYYRLLSLERNGVTLAVDQRRSVFSEEEFPAVMQELTRQGYTVTYERTVPTALDVQVRGTRRPYEVAVSPPAFSRRPESVNPRSFISRERWMGGFYT